jgi:hypothetical protein
MESIHFEKMLDPFRLQIPTDESGTRKSGRECCGHCRTCVYHKATWKSRYCVFRECPFVPGLSTATYTFRIMNRQRDRRRRPSNRKTV